jgi:hypothetical protein
MDISSSLAESCGLTGICPHSSGASRGDVFKGIEVDEDSIQAEVEGRFVRLFKESWRAEYAR